MKNVKKQNLSGIIKVNSYRVVNDAVELGVLRGWNRAHKHVQEPNIVALQEAITDEVMSTLCEVLEFTND